MGQVAETDKAALMAQIDMQFRLVLPVLPRRGQCAWLAGAAAASSMSRRGRRWNGARRRHGAYTAAKAGVAALTVALAEEVAKDGILVNAVAPSIMDTPANRKAMPKADYRRWPKVEEVAATIPFWLRRRTASRAARSSRFTESPSPVTGTSSSGGPQQTAARNRRSHDGAALRIGLVVLLDVVEIVLVVHHQPVRLRDAALGGVGEPIDALEPRAIAEMEARHRIDAAVPRAVRARRKYHAAARISGSRSWLDGLRIGPPVAAVRAASKRRAIGWRRCAGELSFASSRVEPARRNPAPATA